MQAEAELAKKCLQAEETKRKTLALQKQVDKDNRRAEQEKARYVKDLQKTNKMVTTCTTGKTKRTGYNVDYHDHDHESYMGHQQEAITHTNKSSTNYPETVEGRVAKVKDKVRELNPVRRARSLFTPADGSNNPNIPGEDNGNNAWMDAQLNREELDREAITTARYAKGNSDTSRYYNIDHVPIRGPPK